MTLRNVRVQFPVGQGGFHAGCICEDSEAKLRYVVDCGAMGKYSAARERWVDEYLMWDAPKTPLDLLFITHAHADHLNGVEQLLNSSHGMVARTIVMPLLNVVDRLLAFARSAFEDPASATSEFYIRFAIDPVADLSQFEPGQIILVGRGGPGGAPFSRGPNAPEEGPRRPKDWPDRSLPDQPWRPIGRARVRPAPKPTGGMKAAQGAATPLAFVIEDTVGFLYRSSGGHQWLLAPFVDPGVKADTALFIEALAKARKMTVPGLRLWIRKTKNLKALLTTDVADLRTAYGAVDRDLNVTSLSVYSGPVSLGGVGSKMPIYLCRGWAGRSLRTKSGRAGWLGTGDAALANKTKRKAFFKHFGALLEQVHTFVLPHHGSEHNFHVELLEVIRPNLCVAAADRYSNWRHPGTAVVQQVASVGTPLAVVTSGEPSGIVERVKLVP